MLDNWGWCTGACKDSSNALIKGADGRSGCYNEYKDPNEGTVKGCENNKLAWQEFSNIIVVAP